MVQYDFSFLHQNPLASRVAYAMLGLRLAAANQSSNVPFQTCILKGLCPPKYRVPEPLFSTLTFVVAYTVYVLRTKFDMAQVPGTRFVFILGQWSNGGIRPPFFRQTRGVGWESVRARSSRDACACTKLPHIQL